MRETIFQSAQEMPREGDREVVRTALSSVEKRSGPIILGEKIFTSHSVENLPPPKRGCHY